jgi:kumamolisin
MPIHPYFHLYSHLHPNFRRHRGLHPDFHRYQTHRRRHHHPAPTPTPTPTPPVFPPPPAGTWQVPALCVRYGVPTNLAGAGTIGIVELGGGWNQSDMDLYFQSVGLPAPTITDVSVDGTTNSPGSDADVEVALDIQVSGAVFAYATGKAAKINVYWSQSIATAVTKAAADGCAVCSISWGADESDPLWANGQLDAMEAAAAAAVAGGMTVFAASGDNDADDGGGATGVDAPASCPHIVGCGGTTLTATSEVVWNNNPGSASGEGTGGGYSAHFPAQSWQIGIPPAPAGLGRMVPDVAADADPNTGYLIVINGQQEPVGGTSAVAPLYSGLFAAIEANRLGFITPQFYEDPADFNPITQGGNGVYNAGPVPPRANPCCGMGSPIGSVLAATFGPSPQV